VAASPAWSFAPGSEPSSVSITAVATGASVRLLVNGVPHGADVPMLHLGLQTWHSVPYAAGNYTVESRGAAGELLGSFSSLSSGPPVALRADVDWPGSGEGGALLAGARDAALVAVSFVDAQGLRVPWATNNVSFSVSGPGELLGLGNGDQNCHLPSQGSSWMPAYAGLVRAVLRSSAAATGQPLVLTVQSQGLLQAQVSIAVV
jgi:beta-galactosidase